MSIPVAWAFLVYEDDQGADLQSGGVEQVVRYGEICIATLNIWVYGFQRRKSRRCKCRMPW